MILLSPKYRKLKATKERLTDKIVLAQAWKKPTPSRLGEFAPANTLAMIVNLYDGSVVTWLYHLIYSLFIFQGGLSYDISRKVTELALSNELRRQICVQCRNSSRRKVAFSREQPVVWQPLTIENPENGFCFSHESAWCLIADLLEGGHEFKEIVLRKPPGAKAFETSYQLSNGVSIYIKIQPSGNDIFGRSFHPDSK
jgi:hypothetical protein